jgi:hypothetical protein
MEPIKISFDAQAALFALTALAKTALAHPEIVKGIAELQGPLFEAQTINGDFARGTNDVIIRLFPSEQLSDFLRALKAPENV